MSLSKRLEGKVAVVVGGANGFGVTTSELFVKHSAHRDIASGAVSWHQGWLNAWVAPV